MMEERDGKPHEPVSNEEIAALLDGRLTGDHRDEVAARIADDDDAYAAFSEAAHYMHKDVAEEQAPAGERPIGGWWLLSVAAAVIAAVALWPGSTATPNFAAELVASIDLPGDVSSYLYTDNPNLFGFAGPPPDVISFGLGVARVDLELSRVSGTGTSPAAATLLARSATVTGEVSTAVQAVLEQPTDGNVRRLDAAVASELDAFYYRFGQWAEASRIAAASRNAAYFGSPHYQDFLTETENQTLTAEVSNILGRINDASSATVSPETIEPLFDDLILEF